MRLFAITFAFLASTLTTSAQDMPGGEWTGTGFQDGEQWPMTVHFVPGAAQVDYPSFPCGGLWVFKPTTLTGTEWLTYGKDLCWDGLTVQLTQQDRGLKVTWRENNTIVVANAVLKPTQTAKNEGKK